MVERTEYQGWPNCYRLSNGEVELIATSDVGPRIMRYAFPGGPNLFKEFPESLGKSGEAEWIIRGGHRIWIAPEAMPRTYAPDNHPVEIEIRGGALVATQPVEPSTGMRKRMEVRLAPEGSGVQVIHRIQNTTPGAVECAAWALTMMAPGGTAITGLPPRGTHPEMLAPTNPLVIWAFTNLADPRWQFNRKHILLRQDPNNPDPQKIGTFHPHTWGAYLLDGNLFIKRYEADASRTYPDMGCSFETFTNAATLELETLGPLTRLEPGAWLEHTERWSLHPDIRIARWTDEQLDGVIGPLLAENLGWS